MSRKESTSPYNGHIDHDPEDYDIIPEEGGHDDIVPAKESTYDLLGPKKTGYESYDVPRKQDSSS